MSDDRRPGSRPGAPAEPPLAGDDASAADELREVNRFLDAIVENIPDMIFVKRASDHQFIRFNRAGEELLGWKREELLGKTDHDFYPSEEADFFHAKDDEALAGGVLIDVPEEPITTRGKGLRWLHTKKVPVYDDDGRPLYLLGISEDITERKAAAERLQALEREVADVVMAATDAIVSWTIEGTIVSWNPAAEQLYGIPREHALGEHIDVIVPESLRGELRAAEQRLLAGERVLSAPTYRRRGGFEVEVEETVFAIQGGPDRPPRIASIARDIGELARLRRATEILTSSRGGGATEADRPRSEAMREVLEAADLVAKDGIAAVLLLGETGVGKSWLARRIHAGSPRASRAFFEINCASLSPQLVESELFGHERGAFTGAAATKRGLVEVADGGTLFLDEVAELPASVQAQILTFLDDRRFRRVGGTRVLSTDVRLIAATNVDLQARAARGEFRKDLYYRLSVVPLRVPPLRERREEIGGLAERILGELAARSSERAGAGFAAGVIDALAAYDWPGNVRELRNALERALILSRGGAIQLGHLPAEMRRPAITGGEPLTAVRLDDLERSHILRVIESVGGNRTRAAELLGIGRSTLKRKLAEMARDGIAVPPATGRMTPDQRWIDASGSGDASLRLVGSSASHCSGRRTASGHTSLSATHRPVSTHHAHPPSIVHGSQLVSVAQLAGSRARQPPAAGVASASSKPRRCSIGVARIPRFYASAGLPERARRIPAQIGPAADCEPVARSRWTRGAGRLRVEDRGGRGSQLVARRLQAPISVSALALVRASTMIQIADILIDPDHHTVTRAGKRLSLSDTEYTVLEYLARCAGRVVSRAELRAHLYGATEPPESNVLDVYVSRLRRKLDARRSTPLLCTLRGRGYLLRQPD